MWDYPVLYILDGHRLFLHGISTHKTLAYAGWSNTPEFIIVGINNNSSKRYNYFEQKDFLEFIEKELIVFVDKTYRTTDERIIYGWEFAGAYVIESLINKPNLFSGHIVVAQENCCGLQMK